MYESRRTPTLVFKIRQLSSEKIRDNRIADERLFLQVTALWMLKLCVIFSQTRWCRLLYDVPTIKRENA